MTNDKEKLVDAIHQATSLAFRSLLARPEHFYYCSLITTGEAHAPVVSAWSHESLEIAAKADPNPDTARSELKWSYADSPFFCFGQEHFTLVESLFEARHAIISISSFEEKKLEYNLRLSAMEEAMRRVDADGVFGRGDKRHSVAVLVEVMPPDESNTARARRLNSPLAIREWLSEAGE